MQTMRLAALFALSLAALGCSVDEVPDGLKRTPACDEKAGTCGAEVKWDLYHKPLPDIPMPNDTAMWPDPSSRTGLRVNASVIAPTAFETIIREKFDQLEGFGTTAPITVGFHKPVGAAADGAAIDLKNVIKRHHGDDYELADDVIYVVNLTTGVPAVIDIGEGSFPFVLRDKHRYWRNDTRKSEQNLLWETADETVNPKDGTPWPKSVLEGDKPEWDTDFDGVLDRPNLLDPDACPTQVEVALVADPAERDKKDYERDRCITDNLLSYYERETDTIIARPLVPLEEKTQYAVVITDRLLDSAGNPVRSPFDFVYHPNQEESIARLEAQLSDAELASYYGDIGSTGLKHVVFAWTFTTEPVTEDLRVIRDGLYGKGPLASLAEGFPQETKLSRAVGLVRPEDLASGDAEEPANWENDLRCKDKVKNFHIVKFDALSEVLEELASQGFGIEGPALDALIKSFDAVSHIAIGEFESPFFIEGGPKGKDPQASFDMDFRTGHGVIHRDKVQFLIAIPKESDSRKQPFPVAYYGHGYTSSSLEVLGFAGHLAAQGIASVGMNATFHGLELGETELNLAIGLFQKACQVPFASALLSGRARDLDGDGTVDSGGDYWTPYMFHTRDVVRQSAIDLLQMFRTFKGFDGKRLAPNEKAADGRLLQDYNGNGEHDDLAGDFDGNGTPDVGGKAEFYAWGQSLGGFTAPPLAALDGQVVASAPTAGATLMDVGVRTFQGGVYESIYLRMLGPLVVGAPYAEVDAKTTKCAEDEISIRFAVVDVNDDREVEIACVDKADFVKDGGTVLLTNGKNGLVRCARMDKDGRFRVGVPASLGDRLEIQLWDQADVVDSYGEEGCNVSVDDSHRVALINQFGEGIRPSGYKDPITGEPVCDAEGGCTQFQNKYYPKGAKLVAVAEGIGYIRQTPSLRRLIGFATTIVDPADPINYMPLFGLRTIDGPDGKPQPQTALLNTVTIGDMNVPLSAGIAMGRAAGAVPFLKPDAASRYPALADYVTPPELYAALGDKTANRLLIERHVLEGINRLRRESPADLNACGVNEPPLGADVVCHPNCTAEDTSSCLSGQSCIAGRCAGGPVAPDECAQYLYDVDVLDEGQSLYGEKEADVPLRLARLAKPVTDQNVTDVWEPRLKGKPKASTDNGAWKADRRVVAQLMAHINPKGVHGFDSANPCQNFDSGQYMVNLFGRFFASSGADIYYLSHPSSHHCLAKPVGQGSCSFVQIPAK